MSILETLPPTRADAVKEAASGCWAGTDELIGALVQESRHKGAWRPCRAAILATLAGPGDLHMTAEQFGIWKKQARALAKIKGLSEKPVDDLGMVPRRFLELSSAARQKAKGIYISRAEALACAHYLAGYDKPCTPEGLADWFWPRFGSFASVAPLFDWDARAIANRINGYAIEDGARKTVVPEGYFIRALDWVWRFGALNPYGTRPPVAFWPEQELLER